MKPCFSQYCMILHIYITTIYILPCILQFYSINNVYVHISHLITTICTHIYTCPHMHTYIHTHTHTHTHKNTYIRIDQITLTQTYAHATTIHYTDVDECTAGQHTCSHICSNTEGSYNCSCPIGFQLDDDNRTCTGENECHCIVLWALLVFTQEFNFTFLRLHTYLKQLLGMDIYTSAQRMFFTIHVAISYRTYNCI